jgi:hypothetical protein
VCVSRFLRGVSILCVSIPAIAQSGARSAVAPELFRFLQLTSEQAITLNQLSADWSATLQAKTRDADAIRSEIQIETSKERPSAATIGDAYVRLEGVCREATAARTGLLEKTRAVLNRDQLARVQMLVEALNLMPRVVESQRLGLVPDFIQTAPVGLPGGLLTVAITFPPGSPTPLPGCLPSIEVRPEVSIEPPRRR